MARPVSKKSPLQIATQKAREAVVKAVETYEKTKLPADAEKVKAARAAVADALRNENRERFIKIGGHRVSRAVKAIRSFAMCANPDSYGYEDPEIDKAFNALETALSAAAEKFKEAKTGGKGAAPEFSFL